MEQQKTYGPALHIHAHIFDTKTGRKEDTKEFTLGMVSVNLRRYRTMSEAEAAKQKQKEALDRKRKWIVDLIIWCGNNAKSVEFVSVKDDDMED